MDAWIIILIIFGAIGLVLFMVFSAYLDYDKRHLKTAQIEFSNQSNNDFDHIKNNYFQLIEQLKLSKNFKTWNEIQNTKYVRNLEASSGIYIIYLEVNSVGETIPLYIGQSKNIFSRWKQHQNQLRKIVKGETNTRTYRKIMHFLNVHDYSLQDLKFAVVSKCDEKQLNVKEKEYINLFKSDIFGFNQTKGNK